MYDVEGLGGVGRIEGGTAEAFDLGDDISAHHCIVLDDEDGFVASLDARRHPHFRGGLAQARRPRQGHLDRGAVAFLAIDRAVPALLFDDSENHSETKTRAPAPPLCL